MKVVDIRHIRIEVFPESADPRVEKDQDQNSFKVYVDAPAENGQANQAAIAAIRNRLRISGQIRIVSGHRAQKKIIAVTIGN
jgi:uncharacterized protein YggU (UPF0235/DUF167 family)